MWRRSSVLCGNAEVGEKQSPYFPMSSAVTDSTKRDEGKESQSCGGALIFTFIS